MSVKAKCPKCAAAMTIPAELLGKTANCPGCGAKIRVPAPSAAPSAAAAPTGSGPKLGTPPLKTAERLGEPPDSGPVAAAGGGYVVAEAGPAPTAGGPPALPAAAGTPSQEAALPQIDSSATPQIDTEPGAGSVSARVHRRSRLNPAIVMAGIAVVGFAAVIGVALSLMGGGSPDALRFLPADSVGVAAINVTQVRESPLYRNMAANNPQLAKLTEGPANEMGIKPDDIARILIGGGENDRDPVVVVELSAPFDVEQFLQGHPSGRTWNKETVGSQTIHVAGLKAFHFPSDRTIVASRADTLRRVLDPKRQAGFSAKLNQLVGELDFSQTVAAAFMVPTSASGLPVDVPPEMMDQVEGATFHLDVGSDLNVDAVLYYKDNKSAEEFKTMVDGWLLTAKKVGNLPPEAVEFIDSVDVRQSGRTVRGRVTVSGEQIEQGMKKMPGGMPL